MAVLNLIFRQPHQIGIASRGLRVLGGSLGVGMIEPQRNAAVLRLRPHGRIVRLRRRIGHLQHAVHAGLQHRIGHDLAGILRVADTRQHFVRRPGKEDGGNVHGLPGTLRLQLIVKAQGIELTRPLAVAAHIEHDILPALVGVIERHLDPLGAAHARLRAGCPEQLKGRAGAAHAPDLEHQEGILGQVNGIPQLPAHRLCVGQFNVGIGKLFTGRFHLQDGPLNRVIRHAHGTLVLQLDELEDIPIVQPHADLGCRRLRCRLGGRPGLSGIGGCIGCRRSRTFGLCSGSSGSSCGRLGLRRRAVLGAGGIPVPVTRAGGDCHNEQNQKQDCRQRQQAPAFVLRFQHEISSFA